MKFIADFALVTTLVVIVLAPRIIEAYLSINADAQDV